MSDDYLDLDSLEVEETGKPFTFKFDGYEYLLPPDVDIRAIAKLDVGELDAFMRILMGPEQWKILNDSPKTFGSKHFEKVIDGYFKHVGIDWGKSLDSTDSSKSTVEPLKPTSRTTTTKSSRASRQAS